MAAVDLGCWCRQGGDGKLKIAQSQATSELSSFRLSVTNQPAAAPRAEWNARIMRSNCAREEGMGAKGRGSPPHHVFWSLPQHVSAAWRGFSREKRRLSRPWPMAALCEQQGAVCTTTALLFSVCALSSTAEPALSQGLVGILGRHRLDHKSLPLPQSHPRTLPEWSRAQAWRTRFPLHAHQSLSPSSCLLYNIPNSSPRGK